MQPSPSLSPAPRQADIDAVVVGAGFAGLYMLHRLRLQGLRVRVFEAGSDLGGTWYWNGYPGARCDVESVDYSYSFSPEIEQAWTWSERFASQAEILRYLDFVAARLDLRRDIQFDTRVAGAQYDENTRLWTVRAAGDTLTARYLVLAVGCLSAANVPDFDGLDDFQGRWLHTGRWPREGVDLKGKRVGVIGTGSSGIQLIPAIAPDVASLYVFQRSPSFSVPARNAPLSAEFQHDIKRSYPARRARNRQSAAGYHYDPNFESALDVTPEQRELEYEARWRKGGAGFLVAYKDLLVNADANATAAQFVSAKIRALVRDPATAEALVPRDFPIGARRLCLDSNYYATFNRDNVSLVDLQREPLERIVPTGVRTARADYALDVLILATGFDAMTGQLLALDIRGRGGLALREKWRDGARSYLGIGVAGFPNMFVVAGPGSPSVLSNMVLSIEQHVEWVADCIQHLDRGGYGAIEASGASENAWTAELAKLAERTLYPKVRSWYTGANVPGKPRVFTPYVGGAHRYREICGKVALQDYRGFVLTR